jgi:hypothetical protein
MFQFSGCHSIGFQTICLAAFACLPAAARRSRQCGIHPWTFFRTITGRRMCFS